MKKTSYETQLGIPLMLKIEKAKEIYKCPVCKHVVIRHRNPGSSPYVKWCCGIKMIRIANKCSICGICGKHIKGANHFQGKHHLAAVAIREAIADAK